MLRKQIPDNPALPTLIRNLTASGRKVGVTIDSMAPPCRWPWSRPLSRSHRPTTTATTTATSTRHLEQHRDELHGLDDDTRRPPPAVPAPRTDALPGAAEGRHVTGSYFELEQFVNRLEGLKRSFLVTGFTVDPRRPRARPGTRRSPAPVT